MGTELANISHGLISNRWASGGKTGIPFLYQENTGLLGYGSSGFNILPFLANVLFWMAVCYAFLLVYKKVKK